MGVRDGDLPGVKNTNTTTAFHISGFPTMELTPESGFELCGSGENLHVEVDPPMKFKPMLLKGWLHFVSDGGKCYGEK